MATSKDKKEAKRTTDFTFSSSVRNSVVPVGNDTNKNESHIPTSILITGLVVCLVLIILIPVIGVAYMDMNNATVRAIEETRKMRELRTKIFLEMYEVQK
jgi:hypothetical protein